MLFRRAKVAECTFYAGLVLATCFMLWQALKLDFVVHGAIGPGLYPTLVLAALLIASLVLLTRAARSREIRILSPFVEGLGHDVMLRRLAKAAGASLGVPMRVAANTGSGWFSALHSGCRAAPDGSTLVVVTSETGDLANLDAAVFCLDRLDMVAQLWFDPHVLVARGDAPWRDLGGLFGDAGDGALRVGFSRSPEEAASIVDWMSQHGRQHVTRVHDPDAKRILALLRAGELDLAVVSLEDAEPDLAQGGGLKGLAAFSREPVDDRAPVSTAVAQGYPLVFGRWAGLAAPRHPQGRPALAPDRLAAAFVQAQMHVRATGEGGEAGWQVVPAAAFVRFLKDLHEQWKQRANRPGRPEMPRGKVAGFLLGALGLVCFPWFMDLAGFPLATFLFLSVLMTLLWPSLRPRAALTIVPVSLAVTLTLYLLFADLFYVVFPDGMLWGG